MTEIILETKGLVKHFESDRPGLFGGPHKPIRAVDGVDIHLARGETLAVVGESGCGKSTLALLLMGLEKPTAGSIRIAEVDIARNDRQADKALRRRVQMVFQDPYESLNPTQTIEQIVAEPLDVHGLARSPAERRERVCRALEDAGLKPAETYLARFPHQLSGGQRQRVVIAAALVLEPQVLLADEPVSMLDVSIRAEIINLLVDLRATRQISVLFITHDLGAIGAFADRVAVMYLGRVVETGPTAQVLARPQHPYTKALLSVIPAPNPRLRRERMVLQGETPNPLDVPTGCRFHPRCPIAMEKCRTYEPQAVTVSPGHHADCWLVEGK